MDCDESDTPPKKIAKLDDNEAKSHQPMSVLLEETMGRMLDESADLKIITDDLLLYDTFPHGLIVVVRKILNDENINDWQPQMHNSINTKCQRVLELCVRHLEKDQVSMLKLMTLVFDPNTKFQTVNATRMSESVPPGSDIPDEKLYARSPGHPADPRGWLVDLLNKFGDLGGFLALLTRFQDDQCRPTIWTIHVLLRPFGLCSELLTIDAIVKYFIPIAERVQVILDALTDKKLKWEAQNTTIYQDLTAAIDTIKRLVSRVPEQKTIIQNIESSKLRIIFGLVKNVEKVSDTDDSSAELYSDCRVDEWERFLKLFQTNWKTANKTTRENMLELLEKWAKDNPADVIVNRVLEVLWDLVYSYEDSTRMASRTHVQVFAFFNPRSRGIFVWLDRCIDKLKSDDQWAIPALKHIHETCYLYMTDGSDDEIFDIDNVLKYLEEQHNFSTLIINNLINYVEKVRELVRKNPELNEDTVMPNSQDDHREQLIQRLDVLSCVVVHGFINLKIEQVKQIWQCLVEQKVFSCDRGICFDFFEEIGDRSFLKPAAMKDFFTQNILQLNPTLLARREIQHFKKYFLTVNKGKVKLDDFIGIEYLWRIVTNNPEDVARDGFDLLEDLNKHVGSELKLSKSKIRRNFVVECKKQLRIHSDTLGRLIESANIEDDQAKDKEIARETQKMDPIMKFLRQFVKKCGWEGKSHSLFL